MGFEI